jgi:hypothetical protein
MNSRLYRRLLVRRRSDTTKPKMREPLLRFFIAPVQKMSF